LSESAISRRYAKALVGLATEQGQVEQFGEELGRVSGAFATDDYLRQLMISPTFPLKKKSAILADLAQALDLSVSMRNFFGLLLEKDRLKYLEQIKGNYRSFADELSGILRARITTAVELREGQQEAIKSQLQEQTGKRVKLKVRLDPSLIGGLQAEIGGRVFDGSVRTQLKRIEDTLTKG
jgi:F-type H+-transporting ATPase subunit delta